MDVLAIGTMTGRTRHLFWRRSNEDLPFLIEGVIEFEYTDITILLAP